MDRKPHFFIDKELLMYTDLNLEAQTEVRNQIKAAGLTWDREIRSAIKMSELSTNLFKYDRERFDIVLESEISYFVDMLSDQK